MKRKLLISIIILFATITGFAQQSTVRFQGTILPGSASNSIIFVVRPSENFTGVFTNFQFVLQIPESFNTPIPRVGIKKNFLNLTNAGADYVPDNTYNNSYQYPIVTSTNPVGYYTHEGGFHNYLFSFVTVGAPAYTGTQNTEIKFLEVEILDVTVPLSQVRFAQLPDNGFGFGGLSGQHNFYAEANINNVPPPGTTAADYTNIAAPFYSSDPSSFHNDGGGYPFYSWAAIPSALLPVKFAAFRALCADNAAILSWSTGFEQNSNRFEIQKSTDGINWTVIGTVAAANNSAAQQNYQYLDGKGNGAAYYRIREVDNDGQYSYTSVERTNCNENQFRVDVYPVPAKDNLTVSINSDKELKTNLQIIDATGRMVKTITAQINKGKNNIHLDISSLSQGQYFIISNEPSKIVNKKFTVIK
jgi:hypothetical protein